MEVRTFRAPSIQDALQLIREELGPDATLLETRQVVLTPPTQGREIEVLASNRVHVPSRFAEDPLGAASAAGQLHTRSLSDAYRQQLELNAQQGASLVEQLVRAMAGESAAEKVTTK